jgi:hypothetical protein
MESIIVSIKKLQMGMWSAFTNGRTLPLEMNKYKLKFEHNDENFQFVLLLENDVFVSHAFSRHAPEMSSADVFDYSPVIYGNWSKFLDKVKQAI